MKRRDQISVLITASTFCLLGVNSLALAEQKIIQEEKMSFEKCLQVITTSESKLSIAPEISDINSQKRVAIFTLIDGTLTITCDGEKGLVYVSTDTN